MPMSNNDTNVFKRSFRILVQEGIYERFLAKLKETVETTLVLGDGMDKEVNQVLANQV